MLQAGSDALRLADTANVAYFYANATSMQLGGANRFFEANGSSLSLGAGANRYLYADGDVLYLRSAGANVIEATGGFLRLGKQLGNQIVFTTNVLQLSNLVYANAVSGEFWIGPAQNDRVIDVSRAFLKVQALRDLDGVKSNVIWAEAGRLQIGDGITKAIYAAPNVLQIGPDARPVVFANASEFKLQNTKAGDAPYFFANGESLVLGSVLAANSSAMSLRRGGTTLLYANANTLTIGSVLAATDRSISLSDGSTRYFYANSTAVEVGRVLVANASSIGLADASGSNQYFYADTNSLRIGTTGNPVMVSNPSGVFVTAGMSNVVYATADLLQLGDGSTRSLYLTKGAIQIGPNRYDFMRANAKIFQTMASDITVPMAWLSTTPYWPPGQYQQAGYVTEYWIPMNVAGRYTAAALGENQVTVTYGGATEYILFNNVTAEAPLVYSKPGEASYTLGDNGFTFVFRAKFRSVGSYPLLSAYVEEASSPTIAACLEIYGEGDRVRVMNGASEIATQYGLLHASYMDSWAIRYDRTAGIVSFYNEYQGAFKFVNQVSGVAPMASRTLKSLMLLSNNRGTYANIQLVSAALFDSSLTAEQMNEWVPVLAGNVSAAAPTTLAIVHLNAADIISNDDRTVLSASSTDVALGPRALTYASFRSDAFAIGDALRAELASATGYTFQQPSQKLGVYANAFTVFNTNGVVKKTWGSLAGPGEGFYAGDRLSNWRPYVRCIANGAGFANATSTTLSLSTDWITIAFRGRFPVTRTLPFMGYEPNEPIVRLYNPAAPYYENIYVRRSLSGNLLATISYYDGSQTRAASFDVPGVLSNPREWSTIIINLYRSLGSTLLRVYKNNQELSFTATMTSVRTPFTIAHTVVAGDGNLGVDGCLDTQLSHVSVWAGSEWATFQNSAPRQQLTNYCEYANVALPGTPTWVAEAASVLDDTSDVNQMMRLFDISAGPYAGAASSAALRTTTVAMPGTLTVGALAVSRAAVLSNVLAVNRAIATDTNKVCLFATSDAIALNPKSSIDVYGLGMEADTMRYNVPASKTHKWYSGTTAIMSATAMAVAIAGGLDVGGTTTVNGCLTCLTSKASFTVEQSTINMLVNNSNATTPVCNVASPNEGFTASLLNLYCARTTTDFKFFTCRGSDNSVKATLTGDGKLTVTNLATASLTVTGITTGDTLAYFDASKQLTGVNVSLDQLSYLNGVRSNVQEQLDARANIAGARFSGAVTFASTAAVSSATGDTAAYFNASKQLTSLSTVSLTELGHLNGVRSNVQAQLDARANIAGATFSGAVTFASTAAVSSATGDTAAYFNASKQLTSLSTVSLTELGHLNGVRSNVQAQLDARANIAGATFSGAVTVRGAAAFQGNVELSSSRVVWFSGGSTNPNMICLWGSSVNPADTNVYGFGIDPSTLRYNSQQKHTWYTNTNRLMVLDTSGLAVDGALNAVVTSANQSTPVCNFAATNAGFATSILNLYSARTASAAYAFFTCRNAGGVQAELLGNGQLTVTGLSATGPLNVSGGTTLGATTITQVANTDGGISMGSGVKYGFYNNQYSYLIYESGQNVGYYTPGTHKFYIGSTSPTLVANVSSTGLSTASLTVTGTATFSGAVTVADGLDGRVAVYGTNKQLVYSSIGITKLGYLTDVTDNIQSQLDGKAALAGATFTGDVSAPKLSAGASGIATNGPVAIGATGTLTINAAGASNVAVFNASKQLVTSTITSTKLGFLSDVTGGIQGQLDGKAALAGATFTGAISTGGTLTVGGTSTLSNHVQIAANKVLWFSDSVHTNKLCLYGGSDPAATNVFGFGIESGTLRYNTQVYHKWYVNTTQVLQVDSTGVTIGTGRSLVLDGQSTIKYDTNNIVYTTPGQHQFSGDTFVSGDFQVGTDAVRRAITFKGSVTAIGATVLGGQNATQTCYPVTVYGATTVSNTATFSEKVVLNAGFASGYANVRNNMDVSGNTDIGGTLAVGGGSALTGATFSAAVAIGSVTNGATNLLSVVTNSAAASTALCNIAAVNTGWGAPLLNIYCARDDGLNTGASYEFITCKAANDMRAKLAANGSLYLDGRVLTPAADYAEYFEWADGNASDEDRRAMTVTLVDDGKICLANAATPPHAILGVVSTNPAVVADSAWSSWAHKYVTDEFGGTVAVPMELVEVPVHGNVQRFEPGQVPADADVANAITVHELRPLIHPDYDPARAYVSREARREWAPIGLMGKLRVRVGQPVGERWIKMKSLTSNIDLYLVR